MSKFIDSISIKNYRGFKNENVLHIADCGQATFLVGCNNTGKSLIARVFSLFPLNLENIKGSKKYIYKVNNIDDNDFFKFNTDDPIEIILQINKEYLLKEKHIFTPKDEYITWLKKFDGVRLYIFFFKNYERYEMHLSIGDNKYNLFNDKNNEFMTKYGFDEQECIEMASILYKEILNNILVFDSIRSFDRKGYPARISGYEIIEWLKAEGNKAEKGRCKQKVMEWIKDQFNLDIPLSVEPTEDGNEMYFIFDGQIKLNSSEVGTGYTMLYILLMELVRNKRKLIIVDEIESHLQPGMIRALMNILKSHNNKQFIISTHSPVVMETSRENDYLYRFFKNNGTCSVDGFFRDYTSSKTNIKNARILREICNELGVLPAHALLSNCVIWVEGPSEVFWIRAWVKAYLKLLKQSGEDLQIIEGLHYSILMTGGSNITHLDFSEDEIAIDSIEEDYLLKVLKINPNPFVIIDSDNAHKGSGKYIRALKIAKELNNQNRLSNMITHNNFSSKIFKDDEVEDNIEQIPNYWRLKGKELENYAHPQLLKDFYKERANQPASKIVGCNECCEWDVYSQEKGVGKILSERGIKNIAKDSGTIKHKDALARYIFNNMNENHLKKECVGLEKPNKDMIKDLTKNLEKLIEYIKFINYI